MPDDFIVWNHDHFRVVLTSNLGGDWADLVSKEQDLFGSHAIPGGFRDQFVVLDILLCASPGALQFPLLLRSRRGTKLCLQLLYFFVHVPRRLNQLSVQLLGGILDRAADQNIPARGLGHRVQIDHHRSGRGFAGGKTREEKRGKREQDPSAGTELHVRRWLGA